MIEAVQRYDGYVVQSTGDGIFALFGAPAAYEDHPQRALYAALQMQRGVARATGQASAADGGTRDRSAGRRQHRRSRGAHRSRPAGTPSTRRSGTRSTWRRGCRAMAPAGSIAVSEAHAQAVRGLLRAASRSGPTAVKGISEADRSLRSDRARFAADAFRAFRAARADQVRRARNAN